MNKKQHKITNANLEEKIGDCSECGGNVELVVKSKPYQGRKEVQRYCKESVRMSHKKRAERGLNNLNWTRLGLTRDDVETLKEAQSGLCSICKANPATDLDHCHRKDVVRGVLCHGCNTGLGLFHDNPERLRAAADYLELTQD